MVTSLFSCDNSSTISKSDLVSEQKEVLGTDSYGQKEFIIAGQSVRAGELVSDLIKKGFVLKEELNAILQNTIFLPV